MYDDLLILLQLLP